jgi:serine phosphatase RsbU (regulator of sigma subunit)
VSVELANAGHPPPLLIGSDGEIAFVLADVTPPLGAPCELVTSASRQARLGTGDTLVLYTAGVVAGHHKTVDEGIAALAAVAMVSARASVDVLCRRIAEIGELDDDLAVLAVRWDGRSIDG